MRDVKPKCGESLYDAIPRAISLAVFTGRSVSLTFNGTELEVAPVDSVVSVTERYFKLREPSPESREPTSDQIQEFLVIGWEITNPDSGRPYTVNELRCAAKDGIGKWSSELSPEEFEILLTGMRIGSGRKVTEAGT